MNLAETISSRPRVVTVTERPDRKRRLWKSGILITGSLAVLSGVIGLLLSLEAFAGFNERSLSGLGTTMVAAMFPLFLLAAHCMDRVRAADIACRVEYCRRHGLDDDAIFAPRETRLVRFSTVHNKKRASKDARFH